MRFKRVKVGKETTLAAWDGSRWLGLKSALKAFELKGTELWKLSDDLVGLLGRFPEFHAELAELMARSQGTLPDLPATATTLLPFEPLSLRDFMLYEQHAVNSARGYAQLFLPKPLTRAIELYENLSGRVFPGFKPARLWYRKPIYYTGNHLSIVGDGAAISFPPGCRIRDYELELGLVITRPLHSASPSEAHAAIGGFTLFNDFSARDFQLREMKSGFGPCKAKHFASAIGTVVVTPDEIWPRLTELDARVYVNDELVGLGNLAGMRHSLAQAVAYASWAEHIRPGEFMASGTIPGCCGLENGRMLAPGDTIRIEIDGLGSLSNTVARN
jgi:2-keto-4-pentenoate hydratase/2-oxohepta-3-ene-1,7-dioic acid hydratase in catechol pathway